MHDKEQLYTPLLNGPKLTRKLFDYEAMGGQ